MQQGGDDRTTPETGSFVLGGELSGEQPVTWTRRTIAILVTMSLVAVAAIVVVVALLVMNRSADPAERLPDSARFYADVNLDSGASDEAAVRDLLHQFGLDDVSAEFESEIGDLLAALGVDGVEPADVTRWIGARGAIAVYDDTDSADSASTLAIAIASRNDRAARDVLAAIQETIPEFGYVVDRGMVVITIAGSDAQARAEDIVAAGREAPMAEHEPFLTGLERLGGDYAVRAWIEISDEPAYGFDDIAVDDFEIDSDGLIPTATRFLDLPALIGGDHIVAGLQGIGEGFEVHFVAGDPDDWSGQADWLDRLGEVATAQMAGVVTLPDDLGEPGDEFVQFVDDLYNGPLPSIDNYERGKWEYDLALSDDELDEYRDLDRRFAMGTLTEDDPDFDRLAELEDAYWTYGLQGDYDHAADMGWLESYFSVRALSRDEYFELLRIEDYWGTSAVTEADEDWHYQASRRLYAFGLESDYPWYEPDVNAEDVTTLLMDYLSGITITAAADDFTGEVQVGIAAEVAEGRADRLHRLPRPLLHNLFDLLGADPRFDDSVVVFRKRESVDGTLLDHPRFADAFEGMPEEAILALFVDGHALNTEDISVVSVVYGTDGLGVIRALAGDAPTTDVTAEAD